MKSGVQSINDVFHIVNKVENVCVNKYIFDFIDNVEYVVYALYSRNPISTTYKSFRDFSFSNILYFKSCMCCTGLQNPFELFKLSFGPSETGLVFPIPTPHIILKSQIITVYNSFEHHFPKKKDSRVGLSIVKRGKVIK